MASIEAASVDGLNGNYVARITQTLSNIDTNLSQCPWILDITDHIRDSDYACDPNDIHSGTIIFDS